MLSKVGIWIVVLGTSNAVAWAADPQIYLAWDESPPPVEGVAYVIDDTDLSFPSVELRTGSQTWRIWSIDTDNPGNIGDIGYISCPYAQNFGIKILTPTGGQGARVVLGMDLEPTSGSNSSRIVDGIFSTLEGLLILQKAVDGTGGNIGSLDVGSFNSGSALLIPGGVTGNVSIDVIGGYSTVELGADTSLAMLTIGEIGEGSIVTVEKVAGDLSIGAIYYSAQATISRITFTGSLDVGDMEDGSSLYVNNVAYTDYGLLGTAHVGGMHGTALVEVGCPCNPVELDCPCSLTIQPLSMTIDAMNGQSIVRYLNGPGDQSRLEIGEMTGINLVECGSIGLGAAISLGQGIPVNCTLEVNGMSNTSLIDLNDGPVGGTLSVLGTCAGTIANGGVVSGVVDLPLNQSVATFGKVEPEGRVTTSASATGVINIVDTLAGRISAPYGLGGTIRVDGPIGMTGLIEINNDLAGLVQVGQNIAAGGAVTVAGNTTGSGNVNVTGMNSGLIHIAGTMDGPSLIKVIGGMDAGSLIDVNASGASDSTTAGTIWIGGSATQNPLPPVTMLGTVRVNCPAQTKSFAGQVKVVGCASASHQSADICVNGTVPPGNRPILYVDKNCAYKYGTNCTTACGS